MYIVSQIPNDVQFTVGSSVSGKEYLVLVSKSTYEFPDGPSATPTFASQQIPLVWADVFSGEPAISAPRWESDFGFRKPRCDVIAQGAAYSPNGKPAERVRVGLRLGRMVKQFDVVGWRKWHSIGPRIGSTPPQPFLRMPFSYDTAFGGPDRTDPDNIAPPTYEQNPVGLGFATHAEERLNGQLLPNTEEVGNPVRSPFGSYRPMALGPIGRGWPERRRFAGTYDQDWVQNTFPFLPHDFDERYFQMAPEDQQTDFPTPGTEVTLLGLTPRGREDFRLPDTRLPVRIFRGREAVLNNIVLPDTVALDTEARLFTLTWRVQVRIQRDLTEFSAAWIGTPNEEMLKSHDASSTLLNNDVSRDKSKGHLS